MGKEKRGIDPNVLPREGSPPQHPDLHSLCWQPCPSIPSTPSVPAAGPSAFAAASGSRPPRRGRPQACGGCRISTGKRPPRKGDELKKNTCTGKERSHWRWLAQGTSSFLFPIHPPWPSKGLSAGLRHQPSQHPLQHYSGTIPGGKARPGTHRAAGHRVKGPKNSWWEVVVGTPGKQRRHLTLCLVFCRLLRRIFRISSSLSLDRAGRARSTGSVLGLMFLCEQTGFGVTLPWPRQDECLLALQPAVGSQGTQGSQG